MNNKLSKKLIPSILLISSLISGCGKKSNCDIPTKHVHKYIKEFSDGTTIQKYLNDEHLNIIGGYNWTDNYLEITSMDEQLYKTLRRRDLFYGEDNWDYLYNKMANNHDYLEFYYEYYTDEPYTIVDDEGNTEVEFKRVHHDGWTKNPKDVNNTGLTRLYHHRYYGYRTIYKNNTFSLEISPKVDDIREIIRDYPYFNEYCDTTVYEQFYLNSSKLKYITVDDFDVFTSPDLTNKSMELDNNISRKRE